MLGPSGCGKTTTLRCIAGLERPDAGRIMIDNEVVYSSRDGVWVEPNNRHIGMVFQSYAIWPHLSVFDNVAFPLRHARPRPGRAEVRERVHDTLALVKLDGLAERPHLISAADSSSVLPWRARSSASLSCCCSTSP